MKNGNKLLGKSRRKHCLKCKKPKEDLRKDYCTKCEHELFGNFLNKLKLKIRE